MSLPIPGTIGCLKCALERPHISRKNVQRIRLASVEFTTARCGAVPQLLSDHLGWREESNRAYCPGLMVSLPPQMVTEWDSHKSGPGSPTASVWGQPHYKQPGPLPGCGAVPVYGVQYSRSDPQQESQPAVCL